METTVDIRVLEVSESFMRWFEPNEAEPIWLIVNWGKIYTSFSEFLSMHMLELSLDKFDGIVIFYFTHKEYNQVKHLLHCHSIDLCLFILFL